MRLIDANALKSVEKEIVCGKTRIPYAKDHTAILRVYEVDEIRNAPTIDAVPVVRCRDCINRGKDDCPMHIKETEPDEEFLLRVDNDYCSYGKRGGKNAAD